MLPEDMAFTMRSNVAWFLTDMINELSSILRTLDFLSVRGSIDSLSKSTRFGLSVSGRILVERLTYTSN